MTSSLWIFLLKKLLVCNMWKVYTRPTNVSDFFKNVLQIKIKKFDALVGRVWTFHILQTSEKAFSIVRKIHRELPKFQENKVLETLLQNLSFEILFFSLQKQTDLDKLLTFFEKISRIYQENSKAKLKNISLVSIDTQQVASTQTDLD
jgi:hypothetical protein